MNTSSTVISALVLATLSGTAFAQINVKTRTVAAQGDAAPGGGTLNLFTVATPTTDANFFCLNSNGNAFFRSDISGVTAATNIGVYYGAPGALQLAARKGSTADGLPAGVLYGDFTALGMDEANNLAFINTITGAGITSANNEGVWWGSAGSWTLTAQRGSPAPGVAAPGVFSDFDSSVFCMADGGNICFHGTLTGAGITTTSDKGIWAGQPGTLELIAREGNPADGLAAGITYSNFSDPSPTVTSAPGIQISNAGVLYTATLTGTGVTTSNDTIGYFKPNGQAPQVVARKGDQCPLIVGVATYSGPSGYSVNNNGYVLFRSVLAGAGVTTATNTGLFIWNNGTTNWVIRKGDAAPGLSAGVLINDTLVNAGLQPRLGASQSAAWLNTLTGTGVVTANNQVIYYRDVSGNVVPVVRKGDPAPGQGAGVNFNVFQSLSLGKKPGGQVLFTCTLTGTGVTTSNDNTLWSWTPDHGLRLLSREAAVVPVTPSDTRTVATSGILTSLAHGGEDGLRETANAGGQFLYRGAFTDNSARLLVLDTATFPCGQADLGGQGGQPGYDGLLDNNDFVVFIDFFFAQNPIADVGVTGGGAGSDGAFDNNDFVAFINLFFNGCN